MLQSSTPTKPAGCEACCSGEPFPTDQQASVTAVSI
jgi:hypothetical protein